jgi:hypothetical protein
MPLYCLVAWAGAGKAVTGVFLRKAMVTERRGVGPWAAAALVVRRREFQVYGREHLRRSLR